MASRIYDPDHTRHLRAFIRQVVLRGLTGLALAVLTGGAFLAINAMIGVQDPGMLVRLVWIIWLIFGGVSAVHLVLAAVLWAVYLNQRADLDAQGAEAVGEARARMEVVRRDDGDGVS